MFRTWKLVKIINNDDREEFQGYFSPNKKKISKRFLYILKNVMS